MDIDPKPIYDWRIRKPYYAGHAYLCRTWLPQGSRPQVLLHRMQDRLP